MFPFLLLPFLRKNETQIEIRSKTKKSKNKTKDVSPILIAYLDCIQKQQTLVDIIYWKNNKSKNQCTKQIPRNDWNKKKKLCSIRYSISTIGNIYQGYILCCPFHGYICFLFCLCCLCLSVLVQLLLELRSEVAFGFVLDEIHKQVRKNHMYRHMEKLTQAANLYQTP